MTAPASLRDRLIPWYFVAFFAFIALVDGVMVTLAVRTHTGTVTDHPYEKGLAYNKVVEAAEQQAALGWQGSAEYKNGVLNFSLLDADKRDITPALATARFTRPTQAGMDFSATLEHGVAQVKFPAKGVWEVRVNAEYEGVPYQHSRRIVVE